MELGRKNTNMQLWLNWWIIYQLVQEHSQWKSSRSHSDVGFDLFIETRFLAFNHPLIQFFNIQYHMNTESRTREGTHIQDIWKRKGDQEFTNEFLPSLLAVPNKLKWRYASVNSKPDHPIPPQATPGDSNVLTAWGFHPARRVWVLNKRNFLQLWKKTQEFLELFQGSQRQLEKQVFCAVSYQFLQKK